MIKAIATDLDGTLFYPKRKLRLMKSKNVAFLKEMIAEGKKIILVTGRNRYVSSKVAKLIQTDNLTIVGCNGAYVNDNGINVIENPIDAENAKKLYSLLEKDKKVKSILIFTDKYNIILDDSPLNPVERLLGKIGMKAQGVYNEPYVFGKEKVLRMLNEKDVKIYKIMPWYGLQKNRNEQARRASIRYSESVGDQFEITWSKDAVEFVRKGVTKAVVLKQILRKSAIEDDEIMVVGDSGNDVSMFRSFPNSYVMKHAPDEVKKEAKVVVESVADLKKYCS